MSITLRSRSRGYAYASLLLALCACGRGGNNTAPRLATIPAQQTGNGAPLSLDLAQFVTNLEGDPLTYAVTSGGGSFSGSVYTGTFATLGTYTVEFVVTDELGKDTPGSFTVKVTSANLAVYDELETGVPALLALDTDTATSIRFAANGDAVTFKAALAKGQIVYERWIGGQYDLYVWDVVTRTTTVLGSDPSKNERYGGKTTDGKVVFTVASGSDSDLYLWNSVTGLVRTISNAQGQVDENPVVTSGNYVFYERGTSGQRDVYYYNPTEDESLPVANGATAEQIVRAVGADSILLTRTGGSGESDLYYFAVSSGLVEIAGTSASGLADHTKSVLGLDANSRVVFYASSAGTRVLAVADPTTGDLRTVASGSGSGQPTFSFVAGSFVAWREFVSGSNYDVRRYSWSANASALVANSSDPETAEYLVPTGEVYYSRSLGGGDVDLYYWNGTAAAPIATPGSSAYSVVQGFPNGMIVYGYGYVAGTGSALAFYDPATTISTIVTGVSAQVMGVGAATGDFVYQAGTSTAAELYYFTAGTLTSTTIAATPSVGDLFVHVTTAGNVLFRKVDGSGDDLWFWRKSSGAATQITDDAATHATASSFSAAW